ncbi:MAG TPA: ABC transporter ATP-binding protein [Phycisphaerales bacterium]|nr:ABC transporter ATP-binding protein [Phycisphaerales bacterium]
MIELRDLRKVFGPVVAVDGISLQVQRGEVLGFLGPNGAGKSTTMKMITGFVTPSSGTALIAGHDVRSDSLAVRRVLGYLPEGAPAYPDMTPSGFLRWVAEVRGFRGAARARRVDEVVQRVHLEGVLHQSIETLSKGFKRRVGLAQALLHDPDVLILDEPTDGLDPNQKHEVRELIRNLGSEKLVVLSTHILEEVEAVCTRAVIIANGRIVADETPARLQARSRVHNAVRLRIPKAAVPVLEELAALRNVAAVERDAPENGHLTCTILPREGRAIVGDVSRLLQQRGVEVDGLSVEAGRLDEVFRTVTTDAAAGAKGGKA